MNPEDIIRVERLTYKFLWNKKWDGKCPDRIQSQVPKNSYEMGGLKVPDRTALNTALKVKHYINATKSENKINIRLMFLQWFLHWALQFYPLVSLLGGGTNRHICLPVLGD